MEVVRKYWRFEGEVTGVGFRWMMRMAAQDLGVTGWVRNTDYDLVEAEVQGTPQALERLKRYMENKTYAHIRSFREKEIPVHDREEGFGVRF